MPIKHIRLYTNDPPWINEQFKNLIKLRQQAFFQDDKDRYGQLRNTVNCKRQSLCSKYFASKISALKNTKTSQWWNTVKWVAGMVPASASECLLSNLQLEDHFNHSSNHDTANTINSAFLEPMEHYQPLNTVQIQAEDSVALTITEPAVLSALSKLNPRKAAGRDSISNWLLREYAEILVQPITSIPTQSPKVQSQALQGLCFALLLYQPFSENVHP